LLPYPANISALLCALLLQGAVSPWVLGWQFAAGERILQDKDVFGDLGRSEVQLVQQQQQQQGVAVFSEWQLGCNLALLTALSLCDGVRCQPQRPSCHHRLRVDFQELHSLHAQESSWAQVPLAAV
jgi:hypothetical protein